MTLGALIAADLTALAEVEEIRYPALTGRIRLAMHPGAWAVVLFRLATWLHHRGLRPLSRLLYILNMALTGVDCAPGAVVGPGLAIPRPHGSGFGYGVQIGRDVRLYSGARLGGGGMEDSEADGMPVIGDGVWLMDGAKVFGPLHVGDGARIGYNAWVVRDVPAGAIAEGAPARSRPGPDGDASGELPGA